MRSLIYCGGELAARIINRRRVWCSSWLSPPELTQISFFFLMMCANLRSPRLFVVVDLSSRARAFHLVALNTFGMFCNGLLCNSFVNWERSEGVFWRAECGKLECHCWFMYLSLPTTTTMETLTQIYWQQYLKCLAQSKGQICWYKSGCVEHNRGNLTSWLLWLLHNNSRELTWNFWADLSPFLAFDAEKISQLIFIRFKRRTNPSFLNIRRIASSFNGKGQSNWLNRVREQISHAHSELPFPHLVSSPPEPRNEFWLWKFYKILFQFCCFDIENFYETNTQTSPRECQASERASERWCKDFKYCAHEWAAQLRRQCFTRMFHKRQHHQIAFVRSRRVAGVVGRSMLCYETWQIFPHSQHVYIIVRRCLMKRLLALHVSASERVELV